MGQLFISNIYMYGEADGTLLQYCCLENPMDGGAWWAAVHGVAKSWTRPSDFTFTFTLMLFKAQVREGNGNPLQHSCLENPMDGGAWWAAVHGVAKSWTRLSEFTFTHWRRKWQPTPVFLPGESQGRGSLVGCCLWSRTESDMTEAT